MLDHARPAQPDTETDVASAPGPDERSGRRRLASLLLCLGLFLALLGLPPPEGMSEGGWATAALVVLMASLWLTEALPISATALVPLAVGPLIGVGGIGALAAPYASSLIFLLMGGFAIGLAMQSCGLHRRLALYVLGICGARADLVVGGVMLATAVLSMWISNTATAAMMVPIGLSIVTLLAARDEAVAHQPLTVPMLLGVAFAANIGGIGTLIGTPPNAVLAGYVGDVYGIDIGFAQWMLVGLPVATLLLGLCWLVLTRVTYRLGALQIEGVSALVEREMAGMGAVSRAEKRFGLIFGLTVAGWLFRPQIDAALPDMEITDAGIAMMAMLLFFAIPADLARGRCLLDWEATRDLPWGVLILVGGGLSLGALIQSQGLADWIGEMLAGLERWPLPLTIAAVALATMLVSHVASNTATAAALTPVATALAVTIGISPVALGVPLALAASCAFMMPVATPPNAIAFGTGLVASHQMARAGALISVLSLAVVVGVGIVVAQTGFGAMRG